MTRAFFFALGLIAIAVVSLAQGRGPAAPPPPLEPGASHAEFDKYFLASK
jgi:hypothetical protein